tara:strand:+ start:400 stop:561 length:162 start_codon:yes stop_codon:yes gene_type:complete
MEEGVTEYFIALLALMLGLSVGVVIGCYITTREAKEAYRGAKKLNELLNRPYD